MTTIGFRVWGKIWRVVLLMVTISICRVYFYDLGPLIIYRLYDFCEYVLASSLGSTIIMTIALMIVKICQLVNIHIVGFRVVRLQAFRLAQGWRSFCP